MLGKRKIIKLIFLSLGLVIIAVVLFTKRSIDIEEYCRQKTQQVVGNKWETFLDPNPDEYGFLFPYGGNHKITLGFREQLKCERRQKFFYFF